MLLLVCALLSCFLPPLLERLFLPRASTDFVVFASSEGAQPPLSLWLKLGSGCLLLACVLVVAGYKLRRQDRAEDNRYAKDWPAAHIAGTEQRPQ